MRGIVRVFYYIAQKKDHIYILHLFRKKSQKTPKKELDLAMEPPKSDKGIKQMKSSDLFDSIEELGAALGFNEQEQELLALKGSAIARLDKERSKRNFNNAQFSEFLEIPKSRWSSILNNPNKVTVDYLIGLLVKCGVKVKFTLRAA